MRNLFIEMGEIDYSIESEDEFLEDFGTNLSDDDLERILVEVRKVLMRNCVLSLKNYSMTGF